MLEPGICWLIGEVSLSPCLLWRDGPNWVLASSQKHSHAKKLLQLEDETLWAGGRWRGGGSCGIVLKWSVCVWPAWWLIANWAPPFLPLSLRTDSLGSEADHPRGEICLGIISKSWGEGHSVSNDFVFNKLIFSVRTWAHFCPYQGGGGGDINDSIFLSCPFNLSYKRELQQNGRPSPMWSF